MSNYLVTGCAGFIASHVCAQLLDDGHAVVGIDNLNDAYDQRLKVFRLAQLEARPNFRFGRADVTDRPAIERATDKVASFDGNIHLAARAGVRASVLDPWTYYQSNVIGTINMLELCRARKIPKLVVASSSSVYGDSRDVPYRETQVVDRPISPYAASKQATETICYSYHHLHGIDISLLRYFTVYGPAGRPDMSVFRFVRQMVEGQPLVLFGDGSQRRDFTYVDDIARGTIASLKKVGYEIFNLGGDQPYSVSAMLDMLSEIIGVAPRIEQHPAQAADVPQTWADISKAQRLLAWQPQVSFRIGLEKTVAWYRQHRDFASKLSLGE